MSYVVNKEMCIGCGCANCIGLCPVDAFRKDDWTWTYEIDERKCIGCGNCEAFCPTGAIYRPLITNEENT